MTKQQRRTFKKGSSKRINLTTLQVISFVLFIGLLGTEPCSFNMIWLMWWLAIFLTLMLVENRQINILRCPK
jgi:hypothetical protein